MSAAPFSKVKIPQNMNRQYVLAIELRARRFGFVLFEVPATLIDWGVSGYHDTLVESLERKIGLFAENFSPLAIACRNRARIPSDESAFNRNLEILKTLAARHSVAVTLISATAMREYFQEVGRANKFEIAEAVATRFPELAWRLPRKRKPWQSEPLVQPLFDAVAIGIFHAEQLERSS
jgi:hypothetical protein